MTWTIPPRSEVGSAGDVWSRAGAGAPVALIHGVGLRSEAWAPVLAALSTRFAVVAIDLPGHGASARLSDPDGGLTSYVARIADALADLGAPAWIVGHSMGALIALEIAIRRPDLCRGVAALNAIYRRSDAARRAVLARAAALDDATAPDPAPPLSRWFGDDQSVEAAIACRDWLTECDPVGYRAAYRAFAAADGPRDADLRALAAPALFMTGSEEPNSTPDMSRAMAALAPRGRAVVVPGARHMLPMTHPEIVVDALSDWISAHSQDGGADAGR